MATETSVGSGRSTAESGGSTANSESKTMTNGPEAVTENLKCGWLTKRTKMSHKWERRWFRLESNMLHYGNDANSLDKSILLDGTEIAEAQIDRKQFVFCMKPSESRRTYYLQAGSQEELQEWMQAVCFAKAASRHGGASQACCVQ